jgi:hypothetical protein
LARPSTSPGGEDKVKSREQAVAAREFFYENCASFPLESLMAACPGPRSTAIPRLGRLQSLVSRISVRRIRKMPAETFDVQREYSSL